MVVLRISQMLSMILLIQFLNSHIIPIGFIIEFISNLIIKVQHSRTYLQPR